MAAICPSCLEVLAQEGAACTSCGSRPADAVPDLDFAPPMSRRRGGEGALPASPANATRIAGSPLTSDGSPPAAPVPSSTGSRRTASSRGLEAPPSPRAPQASGVLPRAEPAATAGAFGEVHGHGQTFELDDFGGDVPQKLELDRTSRPGTTPEPEAEEPAPTPAKGESKIAPTGPEALAARVRAVNGYGEPPRAFWMTPLYVIRVLKRRREVQKALAARESESNQASTAHLEALAALGQRARADAARVPAHSRPLVDIQSAETVLRARDSALMAEVEAHQARLATVDAEILEVERALTTARQEERAVAEELARREAALGRAQKALDQTRAVAPPGGGKEGAA